jgi:hypothetical protein
LIRLLTTTVKINSTKLGRVIILSDNYTALPFHVVTRKSTRQIISFLDTFTPSEYATFSSKYYSRNIRFYQNLVYELTYFHYYTFQGQHQAAFVNLYRMLEFMSYSFPLIHAAHFNNFLGSFADLRSFILTDKTSELTFLNKFVDKLFDGTPYLGLTTNFNFSNPDIDVANNCYSAFYYLMRPIDWTSANAATHDLVIENAKLIALMKNVRNRFFHFAVGGQRNIYVSDLKDPDFFFESINKQFINWMGFIYKNLVKESLINTL